MEFRAGANRIQEINKGKFLYFAYGSNLLSKRIHINSPTAVKYGIGKLENFRLDFITYSSRWRGASATVVPTEGSHVWGTIWEIDNSNLTALDKQEGVDRKVYFPMELEISLLDGSVKKCRVYQQTAIPSQYQNIEDLPNDRKPSAIYLKVIKLGALESKLPKEYIDFISKIPDNGYSGEVDVKLDLI